MEHSVIKTWLKWLLGLVVVIGASVAAAQDFPTLKGNNLRQGRNATPAASAPGIANLFWWFPNSLDYGALSFDTDNLDAALVTSTGIWNLPGPLSEWAENAYNPNRYETLDPVTNPHYRYAFSTPSASTGQPHVPANLLEHRTWQWQFQTGVGGMTQGNYALYVWIPIGPTRIGGNAVYPQRYYTYEIFYGTGQSQVEVVDTYVGGTGWVRLGNGGRFTNRLYPFDGTTPIRIRLHNTIVRDGFGNLTENYVPNTTPIVYADAALAVKQFGTYRASPTVFNVGNPVADLRVVSAVNEFGVDPSTNPARETMRGVVRSFNHDGLPVGSNVRWSFTPSEEDATAVVQDNTSAGVTPGAGWTTQTAPAGYQGTNFHVHTSTDNPLFASQMTYDPSFLDEGSYDIWVWIQGSSAGFTLSRAVTYEILEGPTVTTVTVDQDASQGWVRLGTRRFVHSPTTGNLLRVRVLNLGPTTENGRLVYADAVRYLGANDTAVNSTPVQVNARVNVPSLGGLVDRPVVITAAENGKLYCLDAVGNGNGTTNIYWTYPSTPDPTDPNWADPNHVVGEDGPGGQAIMPTGFNLSSALVQRINGEDFLFIQSTNGRVYCIAMAGRGDMNLTTRRPGTTTRLWTWPDDYPAQPDPAIPGPTYGSVAFADTPTNGPTLYVPMAQGRLVALDAVGNGNKTTNVRWAFPDFTAPALGPCEMTPAVEFNSVFVGFDQADGDDRGRFYSLDWETGAINWQFNTAAAWGGINAASFRSGPVTIPSTELAGQPNTVVVANDNLWITALDAATGNVLWTTNELRSPVLGNLTYSPMNVFNTVGASVNEPIVLIPTSDGRFAGLFANASTTNVFGGNNRLAWGYNTFSDLMETSMAVGRNFLYGADANGVLYGFNNSTGTAYPPGITPPGQGIRVPNDPVTIPFRQAKIKFITRAMYERLRLAETDPNFPTYAQATDPTAEVARNSFEWGETVYVMAYDFPAVAPAGTQRSQVEFRFSAEGISIRTLQTRAKQFDPPTPNDPVSGAELDGVAVISYVMQGSGQNALPPGPGSIGYSINADFGSGGLQNVPLNPAQTNRNITVANPLGVAVRFDTNGVPLANFALGYTPDPTNPEALVNGSPDDPNSAKRENLLLSNAGLVPHNQQGNALFAVYDRSLMTLLRGPGRGIENVRVVRSDLRWQGGTAAIRFPINAAAYPNFEDLPINFPNISLDYPDIRRESFNIIKDRFGAAENPVVSNVTLEAPTNVDPNNPLLRLLQPTPFTFELNVPRFQPANQSAVTNSANQPEEAGYYGNLIIYVDGMSNGQFDQRGRREAFRHINLGGAVPIDEKIVVDKTEIDLGALPQGTGFSPLAPWIPASPFSPWSGSYQVLFATFRVLNEGNVNLPNVRLAKATDVGNSYSSWGLFAPANNDAGWIDTMFNLWSDIDSRFALNNLAGSNTVLLQKPRVGDRGGLELFTNPIRRDNPILNVVQGPLLANPPSAPPRVAVTVPIGTPVGTYLSTLRVIHDLDNDDSLEMTTTGDPREAISEPGLTLKFTVREARLTNSFTTHTAPMIHGGLAGNEPFLHQNLQPAGMRDLNGTSVVAFASNMANFTEPQPAAAKTDDPWRIYIATLDGTVPSAATFGQNPLRDLMSYVPQGTRWFRQELGPFPTQAPNDPLLFGPDVIATTARFGSPSFAQLGGINPFTGANDEPYLAYVGEAQVQTASGRGLTSKIFLSRLTLAADGTISNVSNPFSIGDNPNIQKGKPALVQVGDRATVFYVGTGSGQSRLYWAHYDGAQFGNSAPLSMGGSIESVSGISAHGRVYNGVNLPSEGLATGQNVIDILVTARLKGMANREVYLARLRANGNGQPINVPGGNRGPVLRFPQQVRERLVSSGEPGVFRSRGIDWHVSREAVPVHPVRLEQRTNNTIVDLEVPNTRQVDENTGLITFETRLGGKVYIDPAAGTLRFAGVTPSQNAQLLLTYTPRYMRISTSSASNYGAPSMMVDQRFISEYDYWANQNGSGLAAGAQVRSDRLISIVGRTAAGTGQAQRPYMRTMRIGIQLMDPATGEPLALHTSPTGFVTNLSISGHTGPYQVDPANGRVYFTAADENRVITVNSFAAIEEGTGRPLTINTPYQATAQWIGERAEAPVLIDQPVNETNVTAFIDPFDNASAAMRRPGLIWMLWTSTRGGGPDIYMQTVAPKLAPRARTIGGN